MTLTSSEEAAVIYEYQYRKVQKNNDTAIINDDMLSTITLVKEKTELPNSSIFFFKVNTVKSAQDNIFLLKSLKIVFHNAELITYIKNKSHVGSLWKAYKKKLNLSDINIKKAANAYENLFFRTKNGLENFMLSSGPYLSFFFGSIEREYVYEKPLNGITFLWITLSIPFKIQYKISPYDDMYDHIKADLIIDEEKLEKMIENPRLQNRLKKCILEKTFTFTSEFDIMIEKETKIVDEAKFKLNFSDNEKRFTEDTEFVLKRKQQSSQKKHSFLHEEKNDRSFFIDEK